MKNYKIYLIRNGLTQGTIEGRYIGHTDESLCSEGKKQVKELSTKGYFPEVEAVFSSPLKRCIETSKIIYPEKEPIIIQELAECDFGEFEGLTADDLSDNEDFKKWIKGEKNAAPPYGESNEQFSQRICAGFVKIVDGLLKTGIHDTAIVTHGGIIMTLLSIFGLPEAPLTDWRTPSGCGYQLNLNASLWSRLGKIEVADEIPFTIRDESDDNWFSDGQDYMWSDWDKN
ncbi:MAG: phosphoglycerate mutase family protein [Clostridiales bacterium]|nr:phosphoglycerate mutase family protein [Clostridiales bacterium]